MSGLVLNKDKLTPLENLCFFCIVWTVLADLGKFSSVLVQLLLYVIFYKRCLWVTPTKRIHWKQNAVSSQIRTPRSPPIYRHETEVTRNCAHHLFKKIQTPTVLNMSTKIRIRRRELTNKLKINIASGKQRRRCFLKSGHKIDPQY